MAPIDFYYMPESPPCRAVEMVAGMVGAELNKHYINLNARENMTAQYLKITPLHQVPTIVDGDLTLGESRAIMMYLVSKFKPDDRLYPHDLKARARIDQLLFYEIGTLYQAASKLLKPMIFGPVKELNAEDEKAFKKCLHYLDTRLGENRGKLFMFGDHLTIADVSLEVSLSFPSCCGYDMSEYKHLVAYLDRMKSAIPNYNEINDKALENTKQFILSKQQGG